MLLYNKYLRPVFALIALLSVSLCRAQIVDALAITEDSRGIIKTNASLIAEHSWRAAGTYISARGTCQFLNTSHFTLSTNLRYSLLDMSIPASRIHSLNYPGLAGAIDGCHHVFSTGVNLTYRTNIGRAPVFTMGMLTIDFSPRGFEHIGGVVLAGAIIKGSKTEVLGLGLIGLLNSTSRWPVYPAVVYMRRFTDCFSVNFMGSTLFADYTPSPSDRLSLGADLDLKRFYFRMPAESGLPTKCKYQKTLVRPQIKFRHTFSERLYVEAVAGVELKVSSHVGGATGRTNFTDVDVPAAPFVRLSAQYQF